MRSSITIRQATIWIILYEIGSSLLLIPSALTTIAKHDAWLAVLAALGFYFMWIPVYAAICKQMNSRSVGDHFQRLFGHTGRKLLLPLFIVLFPYLIFILTLRNLGDFLSTAIIPRTPVDVIYSMMLLAVVYAVSLGVKVLARAVEILFPLAMFLFVFLIISVLPNAKLEEFLPVLEYGWKPPVKASLLLTAFPYMEGILFLFFIPLIDQPERMKNVFLKSGAVSGFMFLIVTASVELVLSPEVTENLTFPSYFVVRTISYANFYERFEVLVAIVWFLSIFFRLSMLMYISAQGLAESFSMQDHRKLLLPLAVIALVMSNVVWPNISYLLEFFKVWPTYAMLFGYGLPLLLWILGHIRLKNRPAGS